MRFSLRFRSLLLVFALNAIVFAAGGIYLVRSRVEENARTEERRTQDLLHTIKSTIRPNDLNVAYILEWPSWGEVEDAILVDRNLKVAPSGEVVAEGIDLNPAGVGARRADFDRQAALRSIRTAIVTERPVDHPAGGLAVPIFGPRGTGVWGGLWYRPRGKSEAPSLLLRLLPWFLLSTVLLTAGTFLALRRMVLGPVEALAEGAGRLRAGDFSVRLDVPRRRDELAELVRSFNDMTSTVEGFNRRLSEEVRAATEKARAAEAAAMTQRRLAAMGELAAGIAHEINNPLGGLENAVESLKRPELPAERRKQYLELLGGGLARIGETVNRLRRFTPRESQKEPVDLAAVTKDAIELVAHRARRLGIAIDLEAPARLPRVLGLRNEIGQAVLNVLANALDSLEEGASLDPKGPRIAVHLQPHAGGVTLVIRDNGMGVEPGELERVMDLFYTTKEVGKGTGLGLALVHSTLSRHAGTVRLSSEPARFFQVELWFPSGEAASG